MAKEQNQNQLPGNATEQKTENSKQKEQSASGSVFLTQIKEKKEEIQQNQKKSIFAQFTQPNSDQKNPKNTGQKKKGIPILPILGGMVALFLIFIVLMVVVIAMGDTNNTLLVNFGIDEARLKDVLVFIVNGSFGLVAFAVLILFVVSIFRISLLKKEEKEKRKSFLKYILISLVFLIFTLTLWFGTWQVVDGIKLDIPLNQLEIVTTPEDVSALAAPVEVDFDISNIINSIVSRGEEPVNAEWDFDGDEIFEYTTEETLVQHRFEQEGNFIVNLIIHTTEENDYEFSKTIKISNAEFDATPSQGEAPLNVAFDASYLERTDSPATSFEWDFDGDGVYDLKEEIATTEYTFDKIGIYNVGLRIIDLHNNFRTYSKKIEVLQDTTQKLIAQIKVSPQSQGTVPFKVTLNGVDSISQNSTIKDYEWNFGDNTELQYGRVVSHTYKTAGEYEATLTIYDQAGKTDSETVQIKATKSVSAPVAKIITDPTLAEGEDSLEGVIPFSVRFDASESKDDDDNIVEYAWDLDGDGEYDEYGQKIDHVFETEGKFTVTVQITDSDEQSSEASLEIITQTRELQAILLADPVSGSLPLKVAFDASTSVFKKGNIATYEWDFGDGGGAEYGNAKRTHLYDKEGKYTVRLKVITEDGQAETTTRDIFVRALQLQSCFSYTPETGTAPLTIEFDTNCSQGEVAKWKWDFGDGYISTSHSPTHTYNQKGEYTVTLDLVDEKNNSSSYQSVIVVE